MNDLYNPGDLYCMCFFYAMYLYNLCFHNALWCIVQAVAALPKLHCTLQASLLGKSDAHYASSARDISKSWHETASNPQFLILSSLDSIKVMTLGRAWWLPNEEWHRHLDHAWIVWIWVGSCFFMICNLKATDLCQVWKFKASVVEASQVRCSKVKNTLTLSRRRQTAASNSGTDQGYNERIIELTTFHDISLMIGLVLQSTLSEELHPQNKTFWL